MTPADQAALHSQQEAIARSAQFYGYTIDSSYTYREIACPLAPRHLLLAYESAAANGAASRFTAVVGRGAGEQTAGGHPVAQIIPILHFGVTPFVPAIANPHSIEVFNAAISPAPAPVGVLSEVKDGGDPLLLRSLCYLAMVGEEPAALHPPPVEAPTIHAPVPTLQFQNHGKTRQLISVRNAAQTYQVWALTFATEGKLLSATREEHPIDRTAPLLNAANTSPAPATSAAAVPANSTPMPRSQPSSVPSASVGPPFVSSATVAATPAPIPSASAPPPAPSAPVSNESAPAPVQPAPSAIASGEPASAAPPQPSRPALQPPVSAPAVSPSVAVPSPVATSAVATTSEPSTPLTPASQPTAQLAGTRTAPVAATRLLPQPPGRFIPSPPLPRVRFIPNSSLQTPPHLPQ